MSPKSRAIYTNREAIAINQDLLGAGAELVSRLTPDTEIWQRRLTSRTGNDVAVMLLNAAGTSMPMHVAWQELGLSSDFRARDVWKQQDLPASTGYSANIAPHTAILLRVHGARSWQHGTLFEAETPSNLRLGAVSIFPCGECSSGYALELGGMGGVGGVRFEHIHVDRPGTYQLGVLYVRNGLEDKPSTLPSTTAHPLRRRPSCAPGTSSPFPFTYAPVTMPSQSATVAPSALTLIASSFRKSTDSGRDRSRLVTTLEV